MSRLRNQTSAAPSPPATAAVTKYAARGELDRRNGVCIAFDRAAGDWTTTLVDDAPRAAPSWGGQRSRRAQATRDRRHRLDARDEPIAAAGLRHDEAMLVARLAEHVAQSRDRLVEVVLLDDDVRPHRLEQRLLVHEHARALDEIEQRVEDLRLQRNRLPVGPEQEPPHGVDAKPVEPICRAQTKSSFGRNVQNDAEPRQSALRESRWILALPNPPPIEGDWR